MPKKAKETAKAASEWRLKKCEASEWRLKKCEASEWRLKKCERGVLPMPKSWINEAGLQQYRCKFLKRTSEGLSVSSIWENPNLYIIRAFFFRSLLFGSIWDRSGLSVQRFRTGVQGPGQLKRLEGLEGDSINKDIRLKTNCQWSKNRPCRRNYCLVTSLVALVWLIRPADARTRPGSR